MGRYVSSFGASPVHLLSTVLDFSREPLVPPFRGGGGGGSGSGSSSPSSSSNNNNINVPSVLPYAIYNVSSPYIFPHNGSATTITKKVAVISAPTIKVFELKIGTNVGTFFNQTVAMCLRATIYELQSAPHSVDIIVLLSSMAHADVRKIAMEVQGTTRGEDARARVRGCARALFGVVASHRIIFFPRRFSGIPFFPVGIDIIVAETLEPYRNRSLSSSSSSAANATSTVTEGELDAAQTYPAVLTNVFREQVLIVGAGQRGLYVGDLSVTFDPITGKATVRWSRNRSLA